MWANENWTRRWDGRSENILLGQDYEHVDSSQFVQDALQYLLDPRYLRIDGKAVLAVYRPRQIPELAETVAEWRRIAEQAGPATCCCSAWTSIRSSTALVRTFTSSV